MDGGSRIETLDRRQCLELLATTQVGRMAFTPRVGDAYTSAPEGTGVAPRVVPVSFVVDDGSLVVRTTHGSQLGRSAPGAPVTFEADDIRSARRDGWSVVVMGRAEVEEDLDEIGRLAGRLQAWAPGFKDLWLRLPMEHVSGRRLLSGGRVVELPRDQAPRWDRSGGWAPPLRRSAEAATEFDGF